MPEHAPLFAMHPAALRQAARIISNRYSDRGVEGRKLALDNDLVPTINMDGGIAVLELAGVMSKRPTMFSRIFGGTSTMELAALVRKAADDESVQAIVLNVDSPGGDVAGTAMLADAVFDARLQKPIHAFISDLGASAAIWVASQAHSITVNSTGEIGSIGVFATIVEFSEALKAEGIKVHILRSTRLKAAGHPDEPKTKEQLGEIQRLVDEIHDHFIAAIARGRGMSLKAAGNLADGRLHIGQKAVDVGLADAVGTLEDVMLRAFEHREEDREQSSTTSNPTQLVGPVAPRQTPKAPEDQAWESDDAVQSLRRWASGDGSGDAGEMDWAKYRRGFAWFDSENRTTFGAYKLPHHEVIGGELVVMLKGVQAAGGAVQGSTGGADIPASDIPGVRRHLGVHFRQFDSTPPWEEAASQTAQTPQKEETEMSDPKAATIQELKEAIRDADADFYVEQLGKGATLDQAKADWTDTLRARNENLQKEAKDAKEAKEKAEKAAAALKDGPGNDALGGAGDDEGGGDGKPTEADAFKAKVAEFQLAGKSEPDAIRIARKLMPVAHLAYIKAQNPDDEALVDRMLGRKMKA